MTRTLAVAAVAVAVVFCSVCVSACVMEVAMCRHLCSLFCMAHCLLILNYSSWSACMCVYRHACGLGMRAAKAIEHPTHVSALQDKRVVRVSCGYNHTAALVQERQPARSRGGKGSECSLM